MKNLFKILAPSFITISLMSCMATTAPDNYGYNDSYNQGYSNGYIDGYYRSPDGNYYAPNVVYSDYNGNSYRNGNVYRTTTSRNQNNMSGRNTNQRREMPTINTNLNGTRTQNNGMRTQNNIKVQPNANSGTRGQSQNNIRVQPQKTRVESQNNVRVQPQVVQPNNNSQRSSGSR